MDEHGFARGDIVRMGGSFIHMGGEGSIGVVVQEHPLLLNWIFLTGERSRWIFRKEHPAGDINPTDGVIKLLVKVGHMELPK